MSVKEVHQTKFVGFRANDALIAAVAKRARKSGCSFSEYLRGVLREKVGMQ